MEALLSFFAENGDVVAAALSAIAAIGSAVAAYRAPIAAAAYSERLRRTVQTPNSVASIS